MSLSFQGAILLGSFLIGSIPFGLIIARIFNVKDLTQKGSGNIGATNVSRVAGFWPAGFLTFVLDVLKGVLPVALVAYSALPGMLGSAVGMPDPASQVTQLLIWTTGLCAVLGHCYSPWLQFKGGKGVATGFGVMLILSPISALIGILGFAFCFFKTKVGSLSSLTGLALVSISYVVMNPIKAHVWAGAALIFIILVRHESNLKALLEGREKRFG